MTAYDDLWTGQQWMNSPIPSNIGIHPDSDAAMAVIKHNIFNGRYAPAIQSSISTAKESIVTVADSQQWDWSPMVLTGNFKGQSWTQGIERIAANGIPIPPDYQLTNLARASDRPLCIVMPDWVSPDGSLHGRSYEFWHAKNPSESLSLGGPNAWTFSQGWRMSGIRERLNGGRPINRRVFNDNRDWAREGVGESVGMGVMASRLPFLMAMIKAADFQVGEIRRPIGFLLGGVVLNHYDYVWPASSTDASGTIETPQGGRYQLDPSYVIPTTLPLASRLILRCMQVYGLVHTDTSGGNFAIRTEIGTAGHYTGDAYPATILQQHIPWDRVRRIAVGNDTLQNPTFGVPDPESPPPVVFDLPTSVNVDPPPFTFDLPTSVEVHPWQPVTFDLPTKVKVHAGAQFDSPTRVLVDAWRETGLFRRKQDGTSEQLHPNNPLYVNDSGQIRQVG